MNSYDPVSVPPKKTESHLGALRRFALAITLLTLAGHLYLGFEQSFAQPLVALAAGYGMQIFCEFLFARTRGLKPRYLGGIGNFTDFLLPTHISSLAVAMLMYFNDRLWIVAFASVLAVASKTVLRIQTQQGSKHYFNPSNLAISATFLLFPTVGITMPWQWTTEISGMADWLFPVVIFCTGSLLHFKYASRIWVVFSFFAAFAIQAAIRGIFFDGNFLGIMAVATGVPAMIFAFYMAPDPATSPASFKGQIAFGASICLGYLILMVFHVVFALFYALSLVCFVRGMWMGLVYYTSAFPVTSKSAVIETG